MQDLIASTDDDLEVRSAVWDIGIAVQAEPIDRVAGEPVRLIRRLAWVWREHRTGLAIGTCLDGFAEVIHSEAVGTPQPRPCRIRELALALFQIAEEAADAHARR